MSRRTAEDRKRAHQIGMLAEYYCILWLWLKGYSVLKRRYRNGGGEIDIIARRGSLIVFIEVKARKERDSALYSVTPDKQRRLARAAEGFLASRTSYAHHGLRFDVMVITSRIRIEHHKDAWRPS